jgi:hypothetical protein
MLTKSPSVTTGIAAATEGTVPAIVNMRKGMVDNPNLDVKPIMEVISSKTIACSVQAMSTST